MLRGYYLLYIATFFMTLRGLPKKLNAQTAFQVSSYSSIYSWLAGKYPRGRHLKKLRNPLPARPFLVLWADWSYIFINSGGEQVPQCSYSNLKGKVSLVQTRSGCILHQVRGNITLLVEKHAHRLVIDLPGRLPIGNLVLQNFFEGALLPLALFLLLGFLLCPQFGGSFEFELALAQVIRVELVKDGFFLCCPLLWFLRRPSLSPSPSSSRLQESFPLPNPCKAFPFPLPCSFLLA